MKLLVTLVSLVAGACYGPAYRDCEIECSRGTCPSGLTCDPELKQCRLEGAGEACPAEVCVDIVASGNHTCARRGDGSVVCWGMNEHGESGPTASSTTCSDSNGPVPQFSPCNPTPTRIDLSPTARLIGAGETHGCAVLEDGLMMCWGDNGDSQFGGGQTGTVLAPVDVGRPDVMAIAAGRYHTCTLHTGGTVKCSGFNERSEVGDGGTMRRFTPYEIMTLPPVTRIVSGAQHLCAIVESDAGVWCWGRNDFSQSDPSSPSTGTAPKKVGTIAGATALALGSHQTCILTAAGIPTCFGGNDSGQLGQGSSDPMPGLFVGVKDMTDQVLNGVREIAAGGAHSCALKTDGAVWCWGGGDGTRAGQIPLGQAAKKVTVGDVHACAILDDDTVWCWGGNELGQHGDGSHVPMTAPTQALVCP